MFAGGSQAGKLKEEFRQHFRNISVIMDCVGCDKCKLWGKLQVGFSVISCLVFSFSLCVCLKYMEQFCFILFSLPYRSKESELRLKSYFLGNLTV